MSACMPVQAGEAEYVCCLSVLCAASSGMCLYAAERNGSEFCKHEM